MHTDQLNLQANKGLPFTDIDEADPRTPQRKLQLEQSDESSLGIICDVDNGTLTFSPNTIKEFISTKYEF